MLDNVNMTMILEDARWCYKILEDVRGYKYDDDPR